MKLRSVLAAGAALLVFSAAVAPAADAATRRRPARHSVHSQRVARAMPMRRGGDAQNADVDRLNAQSLQAARGGTSMAPAGGGMSQ